MTDLNADTFPEFFEALWGKPPFAWQTALARRVLENDAAPWPEAIALPTAAGKTACMDVAVFALAAQADRLERGQPLSAPRRIFFVVDRRVIVDEAYERARKLAEALRKAEGGVLKEVADRLRRLADSDIPFTAHQLRGGTLRSEDWARSPVQPMVVASTVDQIGSRLLFRGYGPGQGMWPVHAGLVGNDSLILLDEAHCAQPFLETLRAVRKYRTWAETPLPVPFHVAVMSATPPETVEVFRDESGEGRDPGHPLGRRQLAAKLARLTLAKKAKGKGMAPFEALAEELAGAAMSLVKDWDNPTAGHPAVVIFCNRVDTARRVHDRLRDKHQESALFTGRLRPLDKEDLIDHVLDELQSAAVQARRLGAPRFVVATQTLEVGADLDFDLLVTECASLDALRQRFGRLNRMGRPVAARAVIIARADQAADSQDDPVYGTALAATWQWLNSQATDEVVDFGIHALADRLPPTPELASLGAPSDHAPVMLPAHLDCLAQTAPVPCPSPDVALYLHGPQGGPADVKVCWRADFTGDENGWLEAIALCPPTTPECLSVPYVQARRWLDGKLFDHGADVEGTVAETDQGDAAPAGGRRVVRWRGRADSHVLSGGTELRPGDVLAIPAGLGGMDRLGTLDRERPADFADRAQTRMQGRAMLRLHPAVLRQWPATDGLLAWLTDAEESDDPGSLAEGLRDILHAWSAALGTPEWSWLKAIVEPLAAGDLARLLRQHPTGGFILVGGRLKTVESEGGDFSDEDDAASSGRFRSLLLESGEDSTCHLDGVAEFALRHARLCSLPAGLEQALEHAGRGHDLGKADPRFQAWLKGGNRWARGPLLAKSANMAQGRSESQKARIAAGYPTGGRHELLSVRLLESVPEMLPTDGIACDLLLHLVESHHGFCRPFAPVVEDAQPIQVEVEFAGHRYQANSATGLERLDAGPAERYWRLTRQFGWWGLAWLEALLRLADHRRSAREQTTEGANHD